MSVCNQAYASKLLIDEAICMIWCISGDCKGNGFIYVTLCCFVYMRWLYIIAYLNCHYITNKIVLRFHHPIQ